MTTPPMFPGFDGLMTLSRREGVDIRPTLLRVLTDLYVQTTVHSAEEETQFVELASRLIDQVDDATLAVVRNRLGTYPNAPARLLQQINARPATPAPSSATEVSQVIEPAWIPATATTPAARPAPRNDKPAQQGKPLSMQAADAAEISSLFFTATSRERARILDNLAGTPLKPASRVAPARADRAIEALEMAAFAGDVENFCREISDVLFIPIDTAEQIVGDLGGEPLACAVKALDMPPAVFQRILIMLDPVLGTSVSYVHRTARLYTRMSERAALIMVAAWRGMRLSVPSQRPKHQATLYDDERQRARHIASQAPIPASTPTQVPNIAFWRNRAG